MSSNHKNRDMLSEEQFRRAIEEAPIPTIMQAEDGQVLQISRSWTELTGYSLSDIPTFDNWISGVVYDGADAVRNHMHELFSGSKRSINVEFTVRTVRKGIRVWSFSASLPGTLLDGRRFIIGMAVDITKRKKSEEALRASEARLSSIFENSLDAVLLTAPDGRVFRANPTAQRMLGMSEQEIIEAGRQGIVVPDERLAKALKERVEKGKTTTELTIRRKDGSTFPVELTSSLFVDSDGSTKTSMIFRDITERKKAEEALKRSEIEARQRSEELQKLMDILPVAVWVSNDPECKVIKGNLTANTFYEAKTEENVSAGPASGRDQDTTRRFFRNGKELFPQELPMQEAAAKNETISNSELEVVKPSGSKMTIVGSAKPLLDDGGKVRGCLGAFIDITERKKSEDALKENEELYRTVFENSEDGFQLVKPIFDKNGNPADYLFLKVNQAYERQTGLKAEQVVGKTVKEIVPNIEPEWIETHGQVDKTGKSLHREIYNDFSKRWYDLYYFKYKEGQVGVLFRDITQRKNLESQLHDKERLAAIGATAGMVGHDIRNPLQAITGDVYLLRDYLSGMPDTISVKHDVAESLESIEQNVSYINKIVADLQDYSRPVAPKYANVNIYDLVVRCFRAIVIPETVSPSIKIDQSLMFQTDPDLFQRIFTNLVINALQAMPRGGKLSIVATQKQNKMVLSVEDTGVGIAEEVKPKLFTPMMTTKAKGQGLGLAVVKRLVEALKGTISFESEEGKGTTFTIELPINLGK